MKIIKKCPVGKRGSKTKKQRLYNNSTSSQRQRILKFFENEKRPLSTFFFRDAGILHPGGRIKELRTIGHKILTYFVKEADSNGVFHRIGQYSYHGFKEVKNV